MQCVGASTSQREGFSRSIISLTVTNSTNTWNLGRLDSPPSAFGRSKLPPYYHVPPSTLSYYLLCFRLLERKISRDNYLYVSVLAQSIFLITLTANEVRSLRHVGWRRGHRGGGFWCDIIISVHIPFIAAHYESLNHDGTLRQGRTVISLS